MVLTAFPGRRHVFNFTSNWLWQNFNKTPQHKSDWLGDSTANVTRGNNGKPQKEASKSIGKGRKTRWTEYLPKCLPSFTSFKIFLWALHQMDRCDKSRLEPQRLHMGFIQQCRNKWCLLMSIRAYKIKSFSYDTKQQRLTILKKIFFCLFPRRARENLHAGPGPGT